MHGPRSRTVAGRRRPVAGIDRALGILIGAINTYAEAFGHYERHNETEVLP